MLTADQLLKVRFIYFLYGTVRSIYMYAVGFRLDSYLYGSIDICLSSIYIYLYGWIDICVSSIYMYAVRFIFVRLD